FVRIVETGSMTAAADQLHMSAPAVVRSLAALERSVGVRLMHRTTRRSSLSDEGREYFERCKRVLADIEEADATLSSRRAIPRGRLRITAPVTFGRMHVAPAIAAFTDQYREIEVELLLLDRIVDLVEEGIDAAIRIGHLADSSMVALPLGETRRVVCASTAYLRRQGTPRTPQDLLSHRNILFTGLAPNGEWLFAGKPTKRVAIRPFLRTNQFDVALDSCLRGQGCAQFLAYQVAQALATGRLKRLLGDCEAPPIPIHLVYPHARLLSANVRAFVDAAAPAIQKTMQTK
ncbi:MAG: LysR family transcriptional regulator, partial [Burkholderiales bacterium]